MDFFLGGSASAVPVLAPVLAVLEVLDGRAGAMGRGRDFCTVRGRDQAPGSTGCTGLGTPQEDALCAGLELPLQYDPAPPKLMSRGPSDAGLPSRLGSVSRAYGTAVKRPWTWCAWLGGRCSTRTGASRPFRCASGGMSQGMGGTSLTWIIPEDLLPLHCDSSCWMLGPWGTPPEMMCVWRESMLRSVVSDTKDSESQGSPVSPAG